MDNSRLVNFPSFKIHVKEFHTLINHENFFIEGGGLIIE
jgi:hypothetical protein